jgi:hypothetical protein
MLNNHQYRSMQLCNPCIDAPSRMNILATANWVLNVACDIPPPMQGLWWRAMATCCRAAAEVGPPSVMMPLPGNPLRYCGQTWYGKGYAALLEDTILTESAESYFPPVLHVLLVEQLWEVWPWQLQQLQWVLARRGQQERTAPGVAAAGAAAVHGVGGGGGSRGSSSSSDEQPAAEETGVLTVTEEWSPGDVSVCWPLLPEHQPSSVSAGESGPGPVTLEQLQLAVCAIENADASGASAAALLLALLLQRADPGLRAEFLGGAGGTTLLAAAQYWGYHRNDGGIPLGGPYTSLAVYTSGLMAPDQCMGRLLAAVEAQGRQGPSCTWREQPGAQGALLLLAWSYLQPVAGWWEEQLRQGGLVEQHPAQYFLAATPYHIKVLGVGGPPTAGECMPFGMSKVTPWPCMIAALRQVALLTNVEAQAGTTTT